MDHFGLGSHWEEGFPRPVPTFVASVILVALRKIIGYCLWWGVPLRDASCRSLFSVVAGTQKRLIFISESFLPLTEQEQNYTNLPSVAYVIKSYFDRLRNSVEFVGYSNSDRSFRNHSCLPFQDSHLFEYEF